MGNELQIGFELFGKIFRSRFAELAVIFLLNILSIVAVLLPIVGYIGFNVFNQIYNNQSNALLDSIKYGNMNYYSYVGGLIGVLLLIVLTALVVTAFIDSFVYIVIKKTNDGTIDGVGTSLSQAVGVWLRMIGFSLLLMLLVIAIVIVVGIPTLLIGYVLAFPHSYASFALIILFVIVVLIIIGYNLGPLFIFAPLDVALSKKPVVQCFTDAISKAGSFKAPIFWVSLVVGVCQAILKLILNFSRIPFLSYFIMIPLALLTPCLVYSYYLKYKTQLETPNQTQPSSDLQNQENPKNTDDIDTGL